MRYTISNIKSYIVGKIRYKIYYSPRLSFLMRKHIKDQIDYRISVMKKECYMSGYCIVCGCQTTALQMANKACDGNCYNKMLNKKEWEKVNGSLKK